jgi:hypothetical protein
MEAMKQKTREKALAEMKASADAFMSAFGDISDSEDEDEENCKDCKEIVNEEVVVHLDENCISCNPCFELFRRILRR